MKISQQDRRQRLEKIKQTAKLLFVVLDYDKVTIEKIIKKCKIAKGTFFNYFESKDHLALTLLGEASLKVFAQLQRMLKRYPPKKIPILKIVEQFLLLSIQHYRGMEHIVYASLSFPMNREEKSFQLQSAFRQAFLWLIEQLYLVSNTNGQVRMKAEIHWHLYLGFIRQWALEEKIHRKLILQYIDKLLVTLAPALEGKCDSNKLKEIFNKTKIERFIIPLLPQ